MEPLNVSVAKLLGFKFPEVEYDGHKVYHVIDPSGGQYKSIHFKVPAAPYDSDFEAAWSLVDELERLGFEFVLSNFNSPDKWEAELNDADYSNPKLGSVAGSGQTVPEAICRAFIAAMNRNEFVLCIKNELSCPSLTVGKLYRLDDDENELLKVEDSTGEEHLYPQEFFRRT